MTKVKYSEEFLNSFWGQGYSNAPEPEQVTAPEPEQATAPEPENDFIVNEQGDEHKPSKKKK